MSSTTTVATPKWQSGPVAMSPELYQYLLRVGVREHPALTKLRNLTEQHTYARMASPPDEGALIAFLLRLIGAKRTLELGVFTGISALATALALPEDGKVVALDVSEEYTNVGRPVWEEAGVAHKIDLRIKPAVETLDELLKEGQQGTFDFAFVDADKVNYPHYYERLLKLVRAGGIIAIDNVLWGGKVIKSEVTDADTVALRQLNETIKDDNRVEPVMLAIADGLTLLRVLPQ
ncbi:CatecholO-methyltransferase domain containing protein 1, putative [Acanthamoeba castellanii str. Neff]|uniref:CatecholO-methyltransferase domain containing protein 1, putative n=1 Tax=Acanthamoeba castellanii (strain ATCC 30010 / Neff) TaxID=1257118 RepID=L8H6V4_ACACF|nr:CatecholO-methyltransferase domain containing protein 1, putative [Acanthamoeba castellanii str. Neff]ELR20880.1 CatecholO-methyltransferase domain containing protein 1, putative [Acanthamoeba castellanii str. Neff]